MNRIFTFLLPVVLLGAGCTPTQAPTPTAPASSSSNSVAQKGEKFSTRDMLFELPAGWKHVSFEKKKEGGGSITRIRVAEDPYRVDLVLYLDPIDLSQIQLGAPLATTPYTTFYPEACGGCWVTTIIDVPENAEMPDYTATVTVEGTEPAPPNAEGPWMPNPTVSQEQVMDMLKTARPIPR